MFCEGFGNIWAQRHMFFCVFFSFLFSVVFQHVFFVAFCCLLSSCFVKDLAIFGVNFGFCTHDRVRGQVRVFANMVVTLEVVVYFALLGAFKLFSKGSEIMFNEFFLKTRPTN